MELGDPKRVSLLFFREISNSYYEDIFRRNKTMTLLIIVLLLSVICALGAIILAIKGAVLLVSLVEPILIGVGIVLLSKYIIKKWNEKKGS